MPLKAILFDLDGVLASTVELHYRSWKKVLSEYSIPFSRQVNEKLRGLTRSQSLDTILGEIMLEEDQKKAILQEKNLYFAEELVTMGSDLVLPGVLELIPAARKAGLKLAVASASRNTQRVINQLGLSGYFDAIVDGNQIRNSKPAPDVFLHAATLLNVKPKDCLVVEDSSAGVQAGLLAGMCVIGIGPEDRVGEATAVFPKLAVVELQNLFEVHNSWNQGIGKVSYAINPTTEKESAC